MQIQFFQIYKRRLLRVATAALFVFSLVAGNASVTLADFLAVGDVVSDNPVDEAGGAVGNLIIGDTGVGGLLADGADPFIGTLMPLTADNVIVGNADGSIGAANVEDFILGGNLEIASDLIVGHAGLGFFDFLNAAGISETNPGGPITTIGGTVYVGGGAGSTDAMGVLSIDSPTLGQGVVRVNGLGSRLVTNALVVGSEGIGVVEVSGRSTLDTNEAVAVGNGTINSAGIIQPATGSTGDGTISLTDLGTRWTASAPVVIGGSATVPGSGSHGKVVVANQAVFQVDSTFTIPPPIAGPGSLRINPRGQLELSGGTVRMLPQANATNFITNNGLILGDGFIDGGINIGPTGELRNAAGLANAREYLLVSEAVSNAGLIESSGGEMEFEQRVTSTGTVLGRDAILRFRGSEAGSSASPDLSVEGAAGSLLLAGNTTIHGDVNVDAVAGASITVFAGANIVFVDNLSFNPAPLSGLAASSSPAAATSPSTFSVTLGETPALSIGGSLDLGTDLTLEVIYDGNEPSMIDDVLTVLTAAGGITGTFANDNDQLIADGRVWEIGYLPNEVFITAQDIAQDLTGDFDADFDVDGADFLAWQRGVPANPPTAGDLADWEANFGRSGPGPVAGITAVPEPSTLALVLLSLACCPRRRSRA